MIESRFEPFIGRRLQIYENRLRERGTIIECTYDCKGIMTFETELGNFSFYCSGKKPMLQLADGRIKLYGDRPRWAYID